MDCSVQSWAAGVRAGWASGFPAGYWPRGETDPTIHPAAQLSGVMTACCAVSSVAFSGVASSGVAVSGVAVSSAVEAPSGVDASSAVASSSPAKKRRMLPKIGTSINASSTLPAGWTAAARAASAETGAATDRTRQTASARLTRRDRICFINIPSF